MCTVLTEISCLFRSRRDEHGATRLLRKIYASYEFSLVIHVLSVTVAEPSKACTVFTRSEAGIMGSNLTQGMDV
jgi:hypothetical protein